MGRLERKAALAALEAAEAAQAAADAAPAEPCALCGRPLGSAVEQHHLVPRSQGGRETVKLHPICHRTIHANFTNAELARHYSDMDAVRGRDAVAKFVRWVANKDPDFDAPTRKAG